MSTRQRLVKLLLVALVSLASTGGCSDKPKDKPLPEIPDGGLKGFKFHGGTAKKPSLPR